VILAKRETLSRTFDSIDRLVYEPVRFLALEKLWILGETRFSDLRDSIRKEIKDLTNGNLAGHLSYLEEAGYVKAHRYFKGRKAATIYSITDEGKRAFEWYLISMLSRLHYSSKELDIPWQPSVIDKTNK